MMGRQEVLKSENEVASDTADCLENFRLMEFYHFP